MHANYAYKPTYLQCLQRLHVSMLPCLHAHTWEYKPIHLHTCNVCTPQWLDVHHVDIPTRPQDSMSTRRHTRPTLSHPRTNNAYTPRWLDAHHVSIHAKTPTSLHTHIWAHKPTRLQPPCLHATTWEYTPIRLHTTYLRYLQCLQASMLPRGNTRQHTSTPTTCNACNSFKSRYFHVSMHTRGNKLQHTCNAYTS
jgi:hypothetical protein